ncbi:DUF4932 domain-containing protein [Pseudoflavitalea sp. X16]|uniref:DUF4932 domain-containing protein n=1 Tax=Paraflavitalea devenefica TaxID=2716334 RepID=UPI00141ED6F7|nr:DUF4932 domain-containing protein [Paraflavitalea devenefica]NII26245.1 DUF4932 domain-containing protein [Paraflavitalea devenefica]
MKQSMLACICCILMNGPALAQPFRADTRKHPIGVQFYKNIEFLGFTFFTGYLAPGYEHDTVPMPGGIKKQDWFAYDFSLYKKYRSFANDPDLGIIARFAEAHEGFALGKLLIHLDEFPRAVIRPDIEDQYLRPFMEGQKDSAATRQAVVQFIEAGNRLYKRMNFDAYFRENARLYEQALKEIRSVLPEPRLVATMEKFYRQQFHRYMLVPSLTIPAGMAFGIHYTTAGNATILNLFGPFARQQFADTASLNMGFANEDHIRELSTHEFGHSFSNPIIAQIPPHLVKETAHLFVPVKEAMENQGYNTWSGCVYEYFVRAGEVVIARKLGKHEVAERLQKHYMQDRKFSYLPLIIEELEKYDRDPRMTYQQAVINAMERLKTQQ